MARTNLGDSFRTVPPVAPISAGLAHAAAYRNGGRS